MIVLMNVFMNFGSYSHCTLHNRAKPSHECSHELYGMYGPKYFEPCEYGPVMSLTPMVWVGISGFALPYCACILS